MSGIRRIAPLYLEAENAAGIGKCRGGARLRPQPSCDQMQESGNVGAALASAPNRRATTPWMVKGNEYSLTRIEVIRIVLSELTGLWEQFGCNPLTRIEVIRILCASCSFHVQNCSCNPLTRIEVIRIVILGPLGDGVKASCNPLTRIEVIGMYQPRT